MPGLTLRASAHIDTDCIVQATVHSAGDGFALVAITDRLTAVDLFFADVADLDRLIEAMQRVRHELALVTQHESDGETAETTVATHAHAA